ncbi:hypothetical protein Tco_1366137 [Tanacetum coccineum]
MLGGFSTIHLLRLAGWRTPILVLKFLEQIRRRFFWGVTGDARKIHWVAWEKVLSNKKVGGLGIGSLEATNLALLSKLWCRFHTEDESLWKNVIKGIHEDEGGL